MDRIGSQADGDGADDRRAGGRYPSSKHTIVCVPLLVYCDAISRRRGLGAATISRARMQTGCLRKEKPPSGSLKLPASSSLAWGLPRVLMLRNCMLEGREEVASGAERPK